MIILLLGEVSLTCSLFGRMSFPTLVSPLNMGYVTAAEDLE